MKSTNHAAFVKKVDTFILAAQTQMKSGMTLPIGGKQLDGPTVVGQLQDIVRPYKTIESLRAQLVVSLAERNAKALASLQFFSEALLAVSLVFANTPELAEFGVKGKKQRKPLTAEANVIRTAKAKATRIARGTKGKRQRKAITGDTGQVTVTVKTEKAAEPPAAAPGGAPGAAGTR